MGTYTIRISWDGNDIYRSYEGTVEIEVVSGLLTSAVQLRSGASAALVYDADGALDCAATEQAIFDAVVETMVPQLTVDDVTVEYYATATTGSLGSVGTAWMPLEGGSKNLLTYPPSPPVSRRSASPGAAMTSMRASPRIPPSP